MSENSISLGIVPHCGMTFYLSKLPAELGTMLALTGMNLNDRTLMYN